MKKRGSLCLTRKNDQGVRLVTSDGEIDIRVASYRSGRIKVWIEAPRGVPIRRHEVVEKAA